MVLPSLPQELVDEILSCLRGDIPSLKACALAHPAFSMCRQLVLSRLKMGPRSKDLTLEGLEQLHDFPEMVQHVRELILRIDSSWESADPVDWPQLPHLPALRRLCISNAFELVKDEFLGKLLSSPSLTHLEVYCAFTVHLRWIMSMVPATLKTLVLHRVGGSMAFINRSGSEPIHLESLTITSRAREEVHFVFLHSSSRIILSDLRYLAFEEVSSMAPTTCVLLQRSAQSLNHLELRLDPESPDRDAPDSIFGRRLTPSFSQLRTITFVFPSAPHPARISRVPSVVAERLQCPFLEEVVLRFNVRKRAGDAWCDDGFPDLDVALAQIPTLRKVSVLIHVVTRGKHSIAEHSALTRLSMPLADARGILLIEQEP
ncbi:hypothetical protein C8R46DRAFT_1140157 [Mycena filopes]|nr:hypothetical protein C8R46DRAFT_1140157 [Mycena filopes]